MLQVISYIYLINSTILSEVIVMILIVSFLLVKFLYANDPS